MLLFCFQNILKILLLFCLNPAFNYFGYIPRSRIAGSEDNSWRRKWQPTPVLLPGESLGQRSLVGYNPWGHRVRHNWATDTYTHDNSLFSSLRNCHIVSQSDSTIVYSHQQGIKILISSQLHQYLFSIFLIVAILMGMRWYLIVALIYVSLMMSDIIFSCVYWPFVHLLWRNAYSSPVSIFNQVYCCWVLGGLCIVWY